MEFLITWVLGIFCLPLTWLWPSVIHLILLFFLIAIWAFKRSWVMLFCVFLLGLSWAVHALRHYQATQLPKELLNQIVLVQGKIDSIPTQTLRGEKFRFRILIMNHFHQKASVYLTWYGKVPSLKVNEHWQLQVKLKPPHGLRNPGGFNYEKWLLVQNIQATGYVRSGNQNFKLKKHKGFFSFSRFRENVVLNIQQGIRDTNLSAIIQALSVGYRGNLSPSIWQVFQRTGTSHLVAISGLHIGFITAMGYFLFSWFWRRFPRLLLYYPAQKAAALFAIIVAISYGALAGFSIPTQRAVIMIVVVMGEQLINRWTPIYFRLLLALSIVLTLQPLSIFSNSFWLSFAAVFWIAYAISHVSIKRNWIKKWLHLQTVIFLGLMPFTFLFFNQISLVLFPANLIAIPWIGFIILPLCLVACSTFLFSVKLSLYFFKIAAFLLKPLWILLNWFAIFPEVVWHHAIVSSWEFLILVLGALCLLNQKLKRYRFIGLLCFLPLFLYHPFSLKKSEFRFTLLDVGEGLASVIQTRHHLFIYDTGPHYYSGFDAGESVIIPYLQRIGANKIDVLIVSHSDNDHSGGVSSILKKYKVQKFLTSIPEKFKRYLAQRCYAGQHWQFDQVNFNILWPPKNLPYLDNNSSCVLKVSNGKNSLLLTGDIEKWAEQKLIEKAGNILHVKILVAPHHGSETSSSGIFLKTVEPDYVLFPSGFDNRFHFPSQAVLKRYKLMQVVSLNTAFKSAIQIKAGSNGEWHIQTVRTQKPFYPSWW